LKQHLKKHIGKILNGAFIATLFFATFSIYSLKDIRFDSNFEKFFPEQSEEARFYKNHRKVFGSDSDFLMLAISSDSSWINKQRAELIINLKKRIEKLDSTLSVTSVFDLKYPIISSTGFFEIPFISFEGELNDSFNITNQKLRNSLKPFISDNEKIVNLIIEHRFFPDNTQAEEYLKSIEHQLADEGITNYHFAGKIRFENVYIKESIKELAIFVGISIVLVILFLTFYYRSFYAVAITVIILLLTLLFTISTMILLGKDLDIMTIVLPCILFVVTTSDVIHFFNEYDHQHNESRKLRLIQTIEVIGEAIFYTSLTTFVAFISLIFSPIKPIQDFGLFTAIGVAYAYIITLIIAGFFILKFPIHQFKKSNINLKLFKSQKFSDSPKYVRLILLSLPIIFWGIYQISIDDKVLSDLSPDHPINNDINFFNKEFGGFRTLEIQFSKNDTSSLIDLETLDLIYKADSVLNAYYPEYSSFSLTKLVCLLNMGNNGGNFDFYAYPTTVDEKLIIVSQLKSVLKSKRFRSLITKDLNYLKWTAKMPDNGSKVNLEKYQRVEKELKNVLNGKLNFQLTGTSYIIDQNNLILISSLFKSLLFNTFFVFILFILLFRSIRLAVWGIFCNIMPLLIIAAIIGFAGIDLTISNSIIFTIAFGIAVDDTIHFLSRYKIESRTQKTKDALTETLRKSGKSMIITSLVICSGFFVLTLSSFKTTSMLGWLITLTMLFALFFDLIILPHLINKSK
jgi:predicted RND superfamily exporter protein